MSDPSWAAGHSLEQTSKTIRKAFLALSIFSPKASPFLSIPGPGICTCNPLDLFFLLLHESSQCPAPFHPCFLLYFISSDEVDTHANYSKYNNNSQWLFVRIMQLTQFKCFSPFHSFYLPHKVRKQKHEVKHVIQRKKSKEKSTEYDE